MRKKKISMFLISIVALSALGWTINNAIEKKKNSTPCIVSNFLKSHNDNFLKKENNHKLQEDLFISAKANGPWLEYSYEFNTKKDLNMSKEDFLEKYNSDKKFRGYVNSVFRKKLVKGNESVCRDKDLHDLVMNHNAGVKIKYMLKDKEIYSVDTIPFTCELFDKNFKIQDKYLKDHNITKEER